MTLKKTKSNKLFKILLAVCSMTMTIFIFHACRKIDTAVSLNKELTNKFFQTKGIINPSVQKVIDKVKKDNEKYHQVNALANNEGLAIWDKALVRTKGKGNAQHRTTDGDNSSEIVIVPLVLEETDYVNSFLAAKITDTIEVKLFSGKDYDEYAFGEPTTEDITADRLVGNIMLLDQEVFGYTKFQVLDGRLFTKPGDTVNAQPSSARLSSSGIGDPTFGCWGTAVEIWWNPDGDPCNCNGDEYFDHWEWTFSGPDCNGTSGGTGGGFGFGGTGGSGGSTGYTGGGGGSSGSGSGNNGVVPIEDETPDPCPKAQEAAKKMDGLFTKSKADSALAAIPNLATNNFEQGFPIYKDIRINPYNVHDTITKGYSVGALQTGGPTGITISSPHYPNQQIPVGTLHTHPPGGYTAQSAADIYSLIGSSIGNTHYQGNFVGAYNGSQYVITVTNSTQAAAFYNTMGQYLNTTTNGWNDTTLIGIEYKKALVHFTEKYDGDPNVTSLAYEMAMAAVLNKFNVGITLAKKNSSGEFKPIVVKTTIIPRRGILKPEKTVYTQECL